MTDTQRERERGWQEREPKTKTDRSGQTEKERCGEKGGGEEKTEKEIVGRLKFSIFVFACVFYFCICTCSAQLSMFHMEKRSRNTLIIIIIIVKSQQRAACISETDLLLPFVRAAAQT